jgi:signal transduction histidine kinase
MKLLSKSVDMRKATPWAALVAIFILLALGISMAIYEEHLYQGQRLREVHEQAQILAASETAALVFHDQKAAQEYVDPMKVNSDLAAVGVYTGDGKLFAGFTRAGRSALPNTAPRNGDSETSDRLIATARVAQGANRLGLVYIQAIAEPAGARAARYAVLALLGIMAVLVLGILAGSQAALTRANAALGEQARELAAANDRLQAEMIEREQVEDALRQSQKMEAIGQLSGGIAHDFNNLLMIVKGNLTFLQRKKDKDPEAANRHIAAAMEGADRAAALTRRILAFSRKQPLFPVELDPNALIRNLGDLIRNSTKEDIAITEDLDASWRVTCDANQLENVVLNLVINSRDALPHGGKLNISTADVCLSQAAARAEELEPGEYVQLTVRDNGTGMPESVRQRALDPFFTTKPVGQGTGLGLSTAFGFVRQSGGTMRIESQPGIGTAVTILLPRVARGALRTPESDERQEARN